MCPFDLDKKTAEAVANLAGLDILTIVYKEAGRWGGDRVPIDKRIEAFPYLIGLPATFAKPVHDPKGMEALQRV